MTITAAVWWTAGIGLAVGALASWRYGTRWPATLAIAIVGAFGGALAGALAGSVVTLVSTGLPWVRLGLVTGALGGAVIATALDRVLTVALSAGRPH